jgi:hypothetical protein
MAEKITGTEGEKKKCLNCGHQGTGLYCSECGQEYTDLHRPMKELLSEILDTINLDKRFGKTIIPFLTRPGFLAEEYLNGRRRKYMSPLRLYLVMSLLFFFLAIQSGFENDLSNTANISIGTSDSTRTIIANDEKLLEYLNSDSLMVGGNKVAGMANDSTESGIIGSRLSEGATKALTNQQQFARNYYKNLSYILFLLMPAFAMLLMLLYIRRRHFYIEHLLFSINMHSFALMVLSAALVLQYLWKDNPLSAWIMVLIPVYVGAGMKRFYKQSWPKTISKEIILSVTYAILILLGIALDGILTVLFI